LTHPTFLVVSAILLLSAITLNSLVQGLKLHFKKEPVAQPRDFRELPPVMGRWLQISEDDKLDKETEDILGTQKYLYRDYLQVDRAGADLVAYLATGKDQASAATQPATPDDASESITSSVKEKFANASFDDQVKMINSALDGKTPMERKTIAAAIEVRNPGDVVHLGLTYYTGLVDTVAHIPDRCYIADGYEPASYTTPTWTLGPDALGNRFPLAVRFIYFEDQTGTNRVPKCVSYVFHANGHYDNDSLGVRRTLENLSERYGYYAKIELMTIGNDQDLAAQSMTEFLTAARGQIEACFPDWSKVMQSHG
jgi:hypothetical protein